MHHSLLLPLHNAAKCAWQSYWCKTIVLRKRPNGLVLPQDDNFRWKYQKSCLWRKASHSKALEACATSGASPPTFAIIQSKKRARSHNINFHFSSKNWLWKLLKCEAAFFPFTLAHKPIGTKTLRLKFSRASGWKWILNSWYRTTYQWQVQAQEKMSKADHIRPVLKLMLTQFVVGQVQHTEYANEPCSCFDQTIFFISLRVSVLCETIIERWKIALALNKFHFWSAASACECTHDRHQAEHKISWG